MTTVVDWGEEVLVARFQTVAPCHSRSLKSATSRAKPVARVLDFNWSASPMLLLESGMKKNGAEDCLVSLIAIRGCQALPPATDESTHCFFGHPHNILINQPEGTRTIHSRILTAFEEDRAITSIDVRNLNLDINSKITPLTIHGGADQFRRLVKNTVKKELATYSGLNSLRSQEKDITW